jgi:diadenosine tetraphosphate (Ap4A) HIT family hydrolase
LNPVDCPFCRKVASPDATSTDELVWRFPHSVALLGTWQFYHGYCVLASKRHARELSGLGDGERRSYLEEMCILARAIERAFVPHKMNYELLGNQVEHPHWHLFPRSKDDPARLSPVWLALDAAERDEPLRRKLQTGPNDRPATIARIRESLTRLNAPHE